MTSNEARVHPENLKFRPYKNAKEGGVKKYALLEDGIVLVFQNNEHYYLYTFSEPGIEHVEQMIDKATKDKSLNTYVTQVVKDHYTYKWIPK